MCNKPFIKVVKKLLLGLVILGGIVVIAAAVYINSLMPIITGYAAKNLCSAVFVSGREQAEVESTDLNFSFIKFNKNFVDFEEHTVTSKFLWGKSTAIFREGFGATLLRDISKEELYVFPNPSSISVGYSKDSLQWPMGDIIEITETGIDLQALGDISDKLINDNGYGGDAFAFMVLHKGEPVAEAYKPQFDLNTRFLSWSMAKSITNALIGIMVRDSVVDIYQPGLLPEWLEDERADITLNNLMQMQSGLAWNEDYGNKSDVTVMLHLKSDFGRFAFEQELEYPVGSHWYYSSGTTNIVSYIIRSHFINDDLYYSFPNRELFHKIGITDAVFEVDASGTMVGSSYLYMSARDYARFALLYLQDGVFYGERLLPEGWVDYTTTPSSASNGEYGSFFWLNGGGEIPDGPADMYMCVGHDGQRIFILPSQEMVIVVLGYSPNGSMDFNTLVSDIVKTVND